MNNVDMLKFSVSQMRQDKQTAATETVSVFLFSVFIAMFLPNILYRFVFMNQQLSEPPVVLEYLPIAAFVLGTVNFLYVFWLNLMRSKRIRRMEQELAQAYSSVDCCSSCVGSCECGDHTSCSCGECEEMTKKKKSKSK